MIFKTNEGQEVLAKLIKSSKLGTVVILKSGEAKLILAGLKELKGEAVTAAPPVKSSLRESQGIDYNDIPGSIQELVEDYEDRGWVATDKQRNLVRWKLDEVLGDSSGKSRHEFLLALCGNSSTKADGGISDAQVLAIIDLMAIVQDDGGNLEVGKNAAYQLNHWYLTEGKRLIGQKSLFEKDEIPQDEIYIDPGVLPWEENNAPKNEVTWLEEHLQ